MATSKGFFRNIFDSPEAYGKGYENAYGGGMKNFDHLQSGLYHKARAENQNLWTGEQKEMLKANPLKGEYDPEKKETWGGTLLRTDNPHNFAKAYDTGFGTKTKMENIEALDNFRSIFPGLDKTIPSIGKASDPSAEGKKDIWGRNITNALNKETEYKKDFDENYWAPSQEIKDKQGQLDYNAALAENTDSAIKKLFQPGADIAPITQELNKIRNSYWPESGNPEDKLPSTPFAFDESSPLGVAMKQIYQSMQQRPQQAPTQGAPVEKTGITVKPDGGEDDELKQSGIPAGNPLAEMINFLSYRNQLAGGQGIDPVQRYKSGQYGTYNVEDGNLTDNRMFDAGVSAMGSLGKNREAASSANQALANKRDSETKLIPQREQYLEAQTDAARALGNQRNESADRTKRMTPVEINALLARTAKDWVRANGKSNADGKSYRDMVARFYRDIGKEIDGMSLSDKEKMAKAIDRTNEVFAAAPSEAGVGGVKEKTFTGKNGKWYSSGDLLRLHQKYGDKILDFFSGQDLENVRSLFKKP